MTKTIIPRVYPNLGGGPLYWQHEESGRLESAVRAYLERQEVTPLFLDYLNYWVDAPAFKANPFLDDEGRLELQNLIERSATLRTAEEVSVWLSDVQDMAIDPL